MWCGVRQLLSEGWKAEMDCTVGKVLAATWLGGYI